MSSDHIVVEREHYMLCQEYCCANVHTCCRVQHLLPSQENSVNRSKGCSDIAAILSKPFGSITAKLHNRDCVADYLAILVNEIRGCTPIHINRVLFLSSSYEFVDQYFESCPL